MSEAGRRAELEAALARVRERLRAAERSAGRAEGSVELVVVTKTRPADDVRLLAGLGVTDVGESREPEAGEKAAACADLPLRWHQVGQVQTRKAAAVAAWADVVHSVDRPRLALALARAVAARRRERPLACLLQVDLDETGAAGAAEAAGTAPRGGAAPADVPALADLVAAAEGLELAGVMAVAPRGADPRRAFDRLREVADGVARQHPSARTVSAGMSGDLEAAVACGATVVRIGTAVVGTRPPMH